MLISVSTGAGPRLAVGGETCRFCDKVEKESQKHIISSPLAGGNTLSGCKTRDPGDPAHLPNLPQCSCAPLCNRAHS